MLNNIVALFDSGAGGGGGSYESIATVTAAGGETSLTFSSIPSTYKALQIRGIAGTSYASYVASMRLTFNGDGSTSNYVDHNLQGNGSSVSASSSSGNGFINFSSLFPSASVYASDFGAVIVDVQDYANTSKNKTVRAIGGVDQNGSTSAISLYSGLWLSTSAVTSIGISQNGTSFRTGSTFALYGIKGE